MADNLTNPTLLTPSGLVIKNVARAEGIDTQRELRIEASLYSWECSRILRRDFPLLTTKMFKALASRTDWRKDQIRSMLTDVSLASETFVAECRPYKATHEFDTETMHHVPLRIISPEAFELYRSFMAVDEGMMRLACAVVDGKMNRDRRRDIFQSFEGRYLDLKKLVMHNRQSTKTAEQMASELRLE